MTNHLSSKTLKVRSHNRPTLRATDDS